MTRKELDINKAIKIKDEIADTLNDNEAEIDLAISVLMSMFITTAIDMAEIPPHQLITIFAKAVCSATEIIDAQEESENAKWLN